MKRKQMNDIITARLWDAGGGKGKEYSCFLNGESIYQGISKMRQQVEEGDLVKIELYHKGYWWKENIISFYMEDTNENADLVDAYLQYNPRGYSRRSKRDYQKSKVYVWERGFPKGQKLTLRQAQALAKNVFDTYGYPGKEPKIEISNRHKYTSSYYSFDHRIALAAGWGQHQRTVLHELAHALIQVAKIKDIANHGKFFVALVTELYELFLDADASDIEENIANGAALGAANTVNLDAKTAKYDDVTRLELIIGE